MNCPELRDHYELYALGLAEEPERTEIREHLARGCEVCMAEMKRAREIVAILGGAPAAATPSPKLRRRILAAVGVEQRTYGWTPLLAGTTLMFLAAAVYFGGREWDFSKEVVRLREESRGQIMELTRLNEAMAILYGSDTTVTSFGEKQPVPKGKVFVNPNLGVLLIASNLPQAPAGKAYEFWLIPRAKGASAIRGGMFQPDSNGTAMHMERRPVDTATIGIVAVTLEVDSGVDAPTSTPLIVAPFAPALQ